MGDTSEPQTVMKIPAIITASLAIFFFATPAQAGHGAFGSCFCGSQDGLEIDKGAYTTDCDPGTSCICLYNSQRGYFYGECVSSRNRGNVPFYLNVPYSAPLDTSGQGFEKGINEHELTTGLGDVSV